MSEEKPVDDALTVIEKFWEIIEPTFRVGRAESSYSSFLMDGESSGPQTEIRVVQDTLIETVSGDTVTSQRTEPIERRYPAYWIKSREAAAKAAAYCWRRGWRPLTSGDWPIGKRHHERAEAAGVRCVGMWHGDKPDAYLNEHLVRLTVMEAERWPEEKTPEETT